MKQRIDKALEYVRHNLNRFLLLAVILSGCFSLRFAAYGKYVDFVNDYTSATAGNFYFSSNYLGKPGENMYSIGSFNRKSYTQDLEIRNYENAFNFNREGQDFYYYLTAEMYRSYDQDTKKLSNPINDASYETMIYYNYDSVNNADKPDGTLAAVRTNQGSTKYIRRDNSAHDYNNNGKRQNIGLIKGIKPTGTAQGKDTANVREKGRQVDRVFVTFTNTQTQTVYLKITAHVVPPTETGTPDAHTTIFKSSVASASELVPHYEDVVGVYDSTIDAIFELVVGSGGEATITAQKEVSESDYTVIYRISSDYDTQVRVVYNPDKLTPDASLGTIYDYKNGLKYVKIDVFGDGTKTCYFFKRELSMNIGDDDLFFVKESPDLDADES